MNAHVVDPPLWQFVLVTLSSGTGVRAQWDGAVFWTEYGVPIAPDHVINWRVVN